MHVIYKNINRIYVHMQIFANHRLFTYGMSVAAYCCNMLHDPEWCKTYQSRLITVWQAGKKSLPGEMAVENGPRNSVYSFCIQIWILLLHFIPSFIHSSIPLHCELVLYLSPKYTHSNSWKFSVSQSLK